MTRSILVNFHLYTPFGKEFYSPMLDFFLKQMKEFEDEYDHLYLLDSNWEIEPEKIKDMKASIIRTNPHMRYYDAYKSVLSMVKENAVLFMDNDMIVYRKGIIGYIFSNLIPYDVATIMDTIGTWKSDKLKLGNKFCPYWFAAGKELLMKYLSVDWSPDSMPDFETLGKLTKAMVEDGVRVKELEDDKSSLLFDNSESYSDNISKGRDLGYYHIRGGSLPAYLLATKKYGDIKTYNDYIEKQPKSEYLRHCAWFDYMNEKVNEGIWKYSGKADEFLVMLQDMGVALTEWVSYMNKFKEYHAI